MSCTRCSPDRWWTNRDELNRLTNDIHNILRNSRGRQAFHEFLNERGFDESEMALNFWEMLDNVINLMQEPTISRSELNEELKKLYRYADVNVNLDASQIKELYDCRREEDINVIKTTLNKISEETLNLIRDYYKIFCQHILTENRSN